jgi:hypothetical protein
VSGRRGVTPADGVVPAPRRPVRSAECLAVAVASVALSVATTWPLASSLRTRAHDPFDALFQAWTIDWVQHALTSASPLWDANIFAPEHRTLAYSDSLVGLAVLLFPARWLDLPPIAALNLGVLLGYATSAAAGYAFGRIVSGDRLVGAVTGATYAFGVYGATAAGHVHVVFHPGPAVAAAAAWVLAERVSAGRSVRVPLAVITVAVALQGTVSIYTCAMTVLATLVVLAVRWRDLRRTGLLGGVLAVAAGLVLLVPLFVPYARNAAELGGDFRWTLRDFGASSADFLAVDPAVTLWGGTLGSREGIFGQPAFPGATVLVLLAGALVLWRRRQGRERTPFLVGVALLAVGAVIAIGTSDEGWRQWAPFRLVYELVPVARALRATGRFWIIGLLGLGLLAGLAVRALADALGSRAHRPRLVAVLLGVAVVGAIFWEGDRDWTETVPVRISEVDQFLAGRDDGGGVLYLPVGTTRETDEFSLLSQAPVVYGTTAHHRRTPNGYSGYYPRSFFELGDRIIDLPSRRAIEHLRSIGVRYVVVPPFAGPWEDLRRPARARPLRLVATPGADLLYELPPDSTA